MNQLVLHSITERHVDDFIKSPSHALIILGPTGSGKSALAQQLASQVLALSDELSNYPYLLEIRPTDSSISIESIRQLENFLSLKVPLKTSWNRLIIINSAHLLTQEAQNALLKILEEPPSGSLLILTASHAQALLPTITSRAQTINVIKPLRVDLESYYVAADYIKKHVQQAYAISGGLPGLMEALLSSADHPLLKATEQARLWLKSSMYERLLMVESLSKQRQSSLDLAFILEQMAHISLQSASNPQTTRWQRILTASFIAIENLNRSAQPKLALTNLALAS